MAQQIGEVQIDIEAPVQPTESVEKVQKAILNFFPGTTFQGPNAGILRGTGCDLSKLKERLAAQAIRDASRRVLLRGIRPGHLYFMVAKQPAFVSRVSFSADGPLGDITVIVRTDNPEALVDYLTEKDVNQRPFSHMDGSRDKDKDASKDEYLGHLEG